MGRVVLVPDGRPALTSHSGSLHLFSSHERGYPPPMTTTVKNRSRALMWWGAALLCLLAGYVDLWRGGETIAPILLIVGYVVLVPAAILKG